MCAYPVLAADRVQYPLSWASGAALLVLAVGLVGRWGPLLQLALTLAVGAYAGYLVDVGDFDRWAPLVAAGLVLTGELAYTSVEPTARRAWPFGVAMVASAALLGALLLGAAGAGAGRVLELAIGVAAAAGALVARLAVRGRR